MIRPPIYLDTKTTDLNGKQVDKLNRMIRFFYNRFVSKSTARKIKYNLSNPISGRSGRIVSASSYRYQNEVIINGQLVLSNMKKGNTYPLFEIKDEPLAISFQSSMTTTLSSDSAVLGYITYKNSVLYLNTMVDIQDKIYPMFTIRYLVS